MGKRTSSSKWHKFLDGVREGGARAWPLIVVGILLAVGLCLAGRAAWAGLAQRHEFRLSTAALSFSSCPPCVRPDPMLRELRKELSATLGDVSIFEPDLCNTIQQKLRGSHWVVDVTEVQRRLPNCLGMEIVFREPVAIVEAGGKFYMADRDGRWLPDTLFVPPTSWQQHHPAVITHRSLSQAPAAGRNWNWPNLAVGARFADLLMRKVSPDELSFTRVDVTNVGRNDLNPDILVWTAGGAQIKWGTSDIYDGVGGPVHPKTEPPVPTRGGPIYWGLDPIPVGPADQRPLLDRRDVLCYRSETLSRALPVIGEVNLDLWIASDAEDTDFVAKLCVVESSGAVTCVTLGSLRCRYREGWDRCVPLPRRDAVKVRLRLGNLAYVFPEGSQIALILTSSCYPRILPHPNTMAPTWTETNPRRATHEILHDRAHPSWILLPVMEL